jgi:hypothetical protein
MHLWNLYEVPAYESGLINTLNPRVGLGSLIDPTITQHHHQQHQQFQTNNQNRIETPLSSSSSSQQSSTSQSFVPSSPFQSKSRIRSFSHNVSHTNHHNHQHHTSPSSPSSSSSSSSSSVSKQQSHSLNHLHSTASLSPSSSTAVTIPSKIPYHDNYNHNNYNQNLPSIFPSLPHLPLKQHQQQQQLSGQLQPKQQSLYIKRLVIQFIID